MRVVGHVLMKFTEITFMLALSVFYALYALIHFLAIRTCQMPSPEITYRHKLSETKAWPGHDSLTIA